MEGVKLFEIDKKKSPEEMQKVVKDDLVKTLSKLVEYLFPKCSYCWKSDYFPFTNPSFEIEVKYNDKDLEILGCGIIQPKILENCGKSAYTGWAFGLGLERLAMKLFDIPDIRYFWTENTKFIEQFKSGKIIQFKRYSLLDKIVKDMTFWLPEDKIDKENNKWLDENEFYELARNFSNDMIEEIERFDIFKHPKTKRVSFCYHITYSCCDPDMKNPSEFIRLVNQCQKDLGKLIGKLGVAMR